MVLCHHLGEPGGQGESLPPARSAKASCLSPPEEVPPKLPAAGYTRTPLRAAAGPALSLRRLAAYTRCFATLKCPVPYVLATAMPTDPLPSGRQCPLGPVSAQRSSPKHQAPRPVHSQSRLMFIYQSLRQKFKQKGLKRSVCREQKNVPCNVEPAPLHTVLPGLTRSFPRPASQSTWHLSPPESWDPPFMSHPRRQSVASLTGNLCALFLLFWSQPFGWVSTQPASPPAINTERG